MAGTVDGSIVMQPRDVYSAHQVPNGDRRTPSRQWNNTANCNPTYTTSTVPSIDPSRMPLSPPPRVSSRTQQSHHRGSNTTGYNVPAVDNEHIPTPLHFDLPMRSVLATGQPTSSLSVNTARASLSTAGANSPSGPLAVLSNTGNSRRPAGRSSESMLASNTLPSVDFEIPETQKSLDDPSSILGNVSDSGIGSSTQGLASLFTSSDARSPDHFLRYTAHSKNELNMYKGAADMTTLGGHLMQVGFREGRHSDITIIAFGQQYKLHKLLLERIPYFSSAFSGSWTESSASEMRLRPEETDPNITKAAFELTIKRVYGTILAQEEEKEAIGVFATACWLDMTSLVEVSVDHILKQMRSAELHVLIKLVTNSYYGKPGERILSAAKAMLFRDGWEMSYESWDGIPAEIVREVIGGDPFYVPGEWERWYLALQLLNRRLRQVALCTDLMTSNDEYTTPKPRHLQRAAIRPNESCGEADARADPWREIYQRPEILPLLQLLDHDIHYLHLRFEQLQQMRYQRDVFGVPILPDKVVSDALWMSLELRQRIQNAQEGDLELGLSEIMINDDQEDAISVDCATVQKGKRRQEDIDTNIGPDAEFVHWNKERERRYWIPNGDVSCVVGGSYEAYATDLQAASTDSRRSQRLSATFEPTDVAWPPDLGASIFDNYQNGPQFRTSNLLSPPKFTRYPPFRFCAEFPHPRTLKEKKRVYSQTVWYAGSMWNLYIQRVNTTKSQQLGIYLHRAKDKDPPDDPLALTVDDRIGQLERELLLRKHERRVKAWTADPSLNAAENDPAEILFRGLEANIPSQGVLSDLGNASKCYITASAFQGQSSVQSSKSVVSQVGMGKAIRADVAPTEANDHHIYDLDVLRLASYSVPAIPPYIDARPTIKTYFRIYSPSKAGRLLSVYESAPDNFNFGKSWGWRSSQMILDDGIGDEAGAGSKERGLNKEMKLRYMVVIGNV